jgi:hypothetical protein
MGLRTDRRLVRALLGCAPPWPRSRSGLPAGSMTAVTRVALIRSFLRMSLILLIVTIYSHLGWRHMFDRDGDDASYLDATVS